MNHKKVTQCASILAMAGLFAVSATGAFAATDEEKAARKAAKEQKTLEKYDANKNGKMDAEEEATMKADADAAKAKQKEKREQKKKEKEMEKSP